MKVFFFHAVNVYVWLSRSIFFRFSDKNESPFSFPKRHFRQALNQAMVTSRANWSKARKIDPVSRVLILLPLADSREMTHEWPAVPTWVQFPPSGLSTVTSLITWPDRDVSQHVTRPWRLSPRDQLVFWRETSRPLSYRRIIIIKKMYWICSELY